MTDDLGKTSTGIQANVSALLCYTLGVVSGIVFLVIEKENKFVRFHAWQSTLIFGGLFVLQVVLPMVPVLGWILLPFAALAGVILWILLMIKAYKGEKFKLPVVGDIAEQKA